jgi:hypothetical protein
MNAQLFLEFLQNQEGVSVAAVHEMHLRSFLYDWFPRKAHIRQSAALGVLTSFERFFRYLERSPDIRCEWAAPLLADREIFRQRWDDFPGGFWWDSDVREWMYDLIADLQDRVMFPGDALGDSERWGATMGITEAQLRHELQRNWLVWRDELIANGTVLPDELRPPLLERQLRWAQTPLEDSGGHSPFDLVMRERKEKR